MEERRKSKRVKADFAVSINAVDGTCISEAKNLSTLGLCFQVSKNIGLMQKLSINLLLPVEIKGKKSFVKLSCDGVVVRSELSKEKSRTYEVSVYFVDVTKQQRKILEQHIKYVGEKF